MANEKEIEEARKIIAGFLKQRREELGYTQAHVAKLTGLGLRTIIRAEAEFWLGMKQFLLICKTLGVLLTITEQIEDNTDIAKAMGQTWKNKKL
jgi:DNA-binding XRE family transcriptional regulator